jgi:Sec-independent protein translocase protein TatA
MPISPDNFKDIDFVVEYVGSSNRNELNNKLRDDNVTVDSLQLIVTLCGELRKLRNAASVAEHAQNSAKNNVDAFDAEREAKKANEEEAERIAASENEESNSTESNDESSSQPKTGGAL